MREKKRRCFVIGPIGDVGSPDRKHADMLLNAVIREALEGSDPPYQIVRSDKVAEPGMINDRVIHEILHADLVVADLTFLNANAFYELGIRHAAEKPTIHFAQLGTTLPFDTFGYRAIMEDISSWDGIERARQQIREAAKATEAENYRVSNPITQANASFKMLESSDPFEQVVAEMQIRLERLETRDGTEHVESGGRWARVALPPDVSLVDLLDHLPRNATNADRILLAGCFAQAHSSDQLFSLGEANALLGKQGGIMIRNAAESLRENLIADRVGRASRHYRGGGIIPRSYYVSQIGMDHLRQVLGAAFPL